MSIRMSWPAVMIYAWGDDVSATALGKAMRSAGCDYGMTIARANCRAV